MDRNAAKFKFLFFLSGLGFGVGLFSLVTLLSDQKLSTEMSAIVMAISVVIGTAAYFKGKEKHSGIN